jgi:outer membrane biosynthesis protein TonB
MMKWEYYSKRRNVSLINFVKNRDIKSYEGLNVVLASIGIEAPDLEMFQSAHATAFPPIAKVRVSKPRKKKVAVTKQLVQELKETVVEQKQIVPEKKVEIVEQKTVTPKQKTASPKKKSKASKKKSRGK